MPINSGGFNVYFLHEDQDVQGGDEEPRRGIQEGGLVRP